MILSAGYYSNEQVQGYILLPLIDLLMSTPASLAISKVSELELLTVLARHDHHKEGLCSSLQTVSGLTFAQYTNVSFRVRHATEII